MRRLSHHGQLIAALTFAIVASSGPARAGSSPEPAASPSSESAPATPQADGAEDLREGPSLFEIVLGTGLIFPTADAFDYDDDIQVTPTSSVYLAGELFLAPRWRLSLAYEVPIGLQTRIVAGEVEEKILQSVLEVGVVAVPFWLDFAERSRIELQVLLAVGIELAGEPTVYPRVGFRLNFLQDASAGLGLLLGINYSARMNRIAFFYGAGYRF
ncbi:MAG: hypothetical protein ACI9MR_000366 [Myxococcota bacterium]|jgi:hypothetical protein